MTYIVRPTMAPSNSFVSVAFISAGSAQLLVGPASFLSLEQMYVWSSTRATSAGSERTRIEFGRFSEFSHWAVPHSTMSFSKS